MDKQIPIYFDSVIVSSPLQEISQTNPNIGRLKVRVFTKYGNRNGSYITDAVAEQLINSAISGETPVIGFFDPETKTWASHTGPTLANGYGYVESFEGWEPFTDTDGITRDYAVFSVVLFTKYFDEAKQILGQNQSMELDPASITGDWAEINGTEYYVYKTAQMLGFCIIGSHEPCFSVSSFFSKDDNTYTSQFEKFSSLLSDLKAQVEEATKISEGGEQPMNEFEQEVVNEQTTEIVEQPAVEPQDDGFQANEPETAAEPEVVQDEFAAEPEPENESESDETVAIEELRSQFEDLQNSYNQLQSAYESLQADFAVAQQTVQQMAALNEELSRLRQTVADYEHQAAEAEAVRKNELIETYAHLLDGEEIDPIRSNINNFSYDELESKLAVVFARKQVPAEHETHKVPLPEVEESSFALLMKKYKKN